METKKTASEKYNQFIDFNGMSRTIKDGHEVAYKYDYDKDIVYLAWETNGEYYHRELTSNDFAYDEELFETIMAYYALHLNSSDVYSVGYWFDVMRESGRIEHTPGLADIVGWDYFGGTQFVDDTTEEETVDVWCRVTGVLRGVPKSIVKRMIDKELCWVEELDQYEFERDKEDDYVPEDILDKLQREL